MALQGKFNRKRDLKDRIFLPKPIRDYFQELEIDRLIVVCLDESINYYTPSSWRTYQDHLHITTPDPFERQQVIDGAETMQVQKVGRVLIPKKSFIIEKDITDLVVEFFGDFFRVTQAKAQSPLPRADQMTFGFAPETIKPKRAVEKKPAFREGQPVPPPLRRISLSDIDFDDTRFLARVDLDLSDLIDSLEEQGQQVPVILRGRAPYTIISGFRRIHALAQLGKAECIALIHKEMDDRQARALILVDNVQRKSFSDFELIRFLYTMKENGYTTVELADLISKGRRIVEQYLRVWSQGSDELKESLRQGRINISAAINAVAMDLPVEQIEGKSVREIIQGGDSDGKTKGPIYFRTFNNGKITLRMQFDQSRHNLTNVIDELEVILGRLREKAEELESQPKDSSDEEAM